MAKKKTIEVNKILNLTNHQAKQILEILETLRSINAQTDDKCPIDYDMVCKLEGMEHQLANIVDATVECEHGHYSRWGGAYEYK
tara:strand:- start:393 stop:644 length:252 start_codon:yes stop_codon:yes gene_type:complete